MRKKAFGLVSLAAPALIGALAASCDKAGDNPLTSGAEELCGPCGDFAKGDLGISGSAELDGFFTAVGTLGKATATIDADFVANIDAIGEAFLGADFDASASLDAKVTDVVAAIKADVSANVDGGVTLKYQPPKCSANVNVAVEAQANCEAKAECDVKVDPGKVAVECKGECSGSCDAKCEGELKCELSASAKCEGKCEGTCTLEAAAACDGTCHGTCDGECSVVDANGHCDGKCDGNCEGSCELSAAATCSGTCSGSCTVEAGAMCEGKPPKCEGSCSGKCEGSCTGEVTPPSASANCEASAKCEAQASAQASASLECTPPSVELAYSFKADLDASAEADFVAHLGVLKARGVAIIQGFTKYNALITGKLDASASAKVVIDPPPLVQIKTSLDGVIKAGVDGLADIPPGRLPCVIPAFEAAASTLVTVTSKSTASLAAQAKFVSAFTTGFSS